MATHLVELGANYLVELGRTNVRDRLGYIELGRGRPTTVSRMFKWVGKNEDPLAGYRPPRGGWSPQHQAIAQKVRTISRAQRGAVMRRHVIRGMEGMEVFPSHRRYMSALTSAKLSMDDFAAKVGSQGDSPVSLDLVGAMANDIPETQVDVANAINQAAQNPDTYNQAVSATAMNLATGGSLRNSIEPQVIMDAEPMVPEIQEDIMTVGPDQYQATLVKGVGQLSAMDQLARGAGKSDGIAGQSISNALQTAQQSPTIAAATQAGAEDLKNSAATANSTAAVTAGLQAGKPNSIPTSHVLTAAGVLTAIGTGIWLFL